MNFDNEALFSDAQAISASGDNISDNIMDLGKMGFVAYNATGSAQTQLRKRVGVAMVIPLAIQVVEDFAGAATVLKLEFQQSDDEIFSSPENVISIEVDAAELIAGYQFPIDKFPREITKRFVRLNFNLDDAASAGKITSGVVAAVDGGYRG